ncbi:autotransporter domain-containing protein [Ahrensia marina]|uniref:autotransporter domain-containing protein n=1 Tax=Ahrensia marina TaxID=1514904 RepID=UPI0035D11FA8
MSFDANALDPDCPADSIQPTVAITGVPTQANLPFTATFTFSEDVTGFELADVTAGLGNADASDFQTVTANRVFSALITPSGTGAVTVAVLAGAAQDTPGGNDNLASGISTTQFTSPQDAAQQQIRDFVGSRMGLITANRPAASRRISRFDESSGSGGETISAFGMSFANPARFALAFEGRELAFAMRSDRLTPVFNAFAAGDGLDTADDYENDTRITFWTEGRITLFEDDATDSGRFGIVHAGVDYLVNERVLLGFSGQVDWLSQDNTNNAGGTDGVGWLAGPTLTVQAQDNFYFDLAAALGQSYNDIDPLGTYTDAFTTNRLFLSGALIGDFEMDVLEMGLFTIQPSLSFTYIVEEQEAYTDSNAVLIAAQTLSQGEVRFGPRIARTFLLVGGDSLSTFVSFDGVYTFGDDGDYSDGSLADAMIGFTGVTELGATYATRSGLSLTLAGNYGGIGSDATLYGGRLHIAIPLN